MQNIPYIVCLQFTCIYGVCPEHTYIYIAIAGAPRRGVYGLIVVLVPPSFLNRAPALLGRTLSLALLSRPVAFTDRRPTHERGHRRSEDKG